jgi:Uma2 family endonuclease
MEAAEIIPKTALDVFRLLPEGTLCEVIDNVLYMSPAPKYNHQRLVFFLARKIADFVDRANIGEVIISPFDVYLEHLLSAVQPDILFISNENKNVLKEDGHIHGAPDLIVEVLSGDRKRDTIRKKSLYERAGVKEYFVVNPSNRQVHCFILKDGAYQLAYEAEGRFASGLLGLTFEF